MNVSLTPDLESFVSAKVESGRYRTASEVVREALRLLEKRELETAVLEGLRSGEPVEISAGFWERKRAELLARHADET